MNLEDETLLSAYLDDELDPARRLSIETALLTDPRLAERVQQLVSVRSTLARLPRPLVGEDLSVPVLARAEVLPSVRFRRALHSASNRRRLGLIGACLGAAAAVLLVAPLWPSRTLPEPGVVGLAETRHGTDMASVPLPARGEGPTIPPTGSEAVTTARLREVAIPEHPLQTPSGLVAPEVVDVENQEDRDAIRGYLERDDIRRLLVVLDTITPRSVNEVRGAIQETGRSNPILGELHIAQGIEIDPERPQEAVVFLVVLDDLEFQYLSENLRRHDLQPEIEDHSLAPSVVTQLADIRVMNLSPGRPAPALRPAPPEALGPLHLAAKATGELGSAMNDAYSTLDDPEPGPIPSPSPTDERPGKVYLVWITTPRPGHEPAPM